MRGTKMTHKITATLLVNIETNKHEYCHHNNGNPCQPDNCIGAEVIESHKKLPVNLPKHKREEYIKNHPVERKINFYCLPQPRVIILSEE